MKPLIVLLAAFAIALVVIKIITGGWDFPQAGTIAMSIMLLFTSTAHFAFTKGMTMMVPEFVPYKKQFVFLTGIFEIIAAVALLIPSYRHTTAIVVIIFFIVMLPANINAAIKKVDYQKGNYEGSGTGYLWFRVPLQIFFIFWLYWFSYRQ